MDMRALAVEMVRDIRAKVATIIAPLQAKLSEHNDRLDSIDTTLSSQLCLSAEQYRENKELCEAIDAANKAETQKLTDLLAEQKGPDADAFFAELIRELDDA